MSDGPAPRRKRKRRFGWRFLRKRWVRRAMGIWLIHPFMRLVALTSRAVYAPEDLRDKCRAAEPALYVSWHGHNLLGFLLRDDPGQVDVLVSPHPDGQLTAGYSLALGCGIIEGTGRSSPKRAGHNVNQAYRQMLASLKAGRSLFLTADQPTIRGRNVSDGAITVAARSGRPIIPIATSSSRRIVAERAWDQAELHLPFSRLGIVAGDPIFVENTEEGIERARAEVKRSLDAVLERAVAVADGTI